MISSRFPPGNVFFPRRNVYFPLGTYSQTAHSQLQSICDPLGSLVADDKNWKTLLLLAAIQDITVRATWISTKANAIADTLARIDSIDPTRFTGHSMWQGATQTAADRSLNKDDYNSSAVGKAMLY
jgi:hypothetical protein